MAAAPDPLPLLLRLWLAVTAVLPGLPGWLARRAHRRQGADPGRIGERLGQAGLPRPAGTLVWVHAASVGEVTSGAPLLRARRGAGLVDAVLLTTATATGAATAARLMPDALHQFMPVDTPAAVARFLAHWRPDTALFVEADLWPRLILRLAEAGCPMALLNARASRSRARFPAVYRALLSRMALVTVQSRDLLAEFARLGLGPDRLAAPGNLKAEAAGLAVDGALRAAILQAAAGRGLWAAVSTHPGEDEVVLAAHAALPGAPLLLLVPRHPERGAALAEDLRRRGLAFTRHSLGQSPDQATRVHLVDAIGLTGTVYAAAELALVGGSLVPGIGGHTPFEPAASGCAVLTGPHVANFAAPYRELVGAGAALVLAAPDRLLPEVARLLGDPGARAGMQAAARAAHAAQAGATAATLALVARIIRPQAGAGSGG
jgi:3-deoxy-D-manno-octulosonic-acid transferase